MGFINFTSGYLSQENENTNLERCLHPHIHWRIIYNSQDMEATQIPTDRWIDQEDVAHICVCVCVCIHILCVYIYIYIYTCTHNEILFSQKNEWNLVICNNMDEVWGPYAKRKNQTKMPYELSYMCILKKKNKPKFIDTEDTGGCQSWRMKGERNT